MTQTPPTTPTTVYVLIRTDYKGNDAVISVHATHESAEAAKTAILSRKGFLALRAPALDIEEHIGGFFGRT